MEFANPLPRPLKKKIPFVKFVPTVFKNWTWQEYETNQASLAPSLRLLLRYTKSPRPMKNSQSATEGVIYTITDWLGRRQMIFFFFFNTHVCHALLSSHIVRLNKYFFLFWKLQAPILLWRHSLSPDFYFVWWRQGRRSETCGQRGNDAFTFAVIYPFPPQFHHVFSQPKEMWNFEQSYTSLNIQTTYKVFQQ